MNVGGARCIQRRAFLRNSHDSSIRRRVLDTIGLYAATLLGACSGPSGTSSPDAGPTTDSGAEADACVPGLSVGCVGPLGCSGFQVCNQQGTGFDPCDCQGYDAASLDSAADAPLGMEGG